MDWTDVALTVAGTAVSIAVPALSPFLIGLMRTRTHSADVQLWQEAGVNAAGRVILNATNAALGGKLNANNLPDFINTQVKAEAAHIVTNLLPQVSEKLKKTVDDAADTVAGKLGNQVDKVIASLPMDAGVLNIPGLTSPNFTVGSDNQSGGGG